MDKEPTDNTIDYETGGFEDIAGTPMVASSEASVVSSSPEPDDPEEASTEAGASVPQQSLVEPATEEATPTEPVVTDPMEKAERAADVAESDAKELNHLKKVLESDESPVAPHTEQPETQPETQPVDVRQDFIDQMHQQKIKKNGGMTGGKKVAIAMAVVLLLGIAGFFTWWFAYYSRTDVVLADALRKFVSADSINVGAVLETTDEDSNAQQVVLTSEIHGLTESSHFLAVNPVGDDTETPGFKAEATLLDDGTLYVKTSGLGNFDTEDSEELEEVDDKWYQLGIDEVLQFAGVDNETARPIADFYNCSIAVAGQDYSKDLITLYKEYPFLVAQKSAADAVTSGATVYDLSIKYTTLADFLNALPSLGAAESFYVCYNTMAESLGRAEISAESFAEIDAEDLEEAFPADYLLQFEIRNFGHELVRVLASWNDDGTQQDLSIDFDYVYNELSIPEEYWTPEDFITVLQDYSVVLLGQMLGTEIDDEDLEDSEEYDNDGDYDDDDYEYDEDEEDWYLDEDFYDDEDEDEDED